MNVKALLDDAAAEATAGLRVDVRAAYAGSNERRARVRWRASAMMASVVAVAAVVALAAVALPAGGWLHRSAAVLPGNGGSVGLPDKWYGLNSWAPSLSRTRMSAASMVLAGSDGPTLVSADGSQYARLPWSVDDQQVALSADGRDVAWVSPGTRAGGKHGPVIHRIRLLDGRARDATLPGGASQQVVRQIIWAGQSLYVVSGGSAAGSGLHTWRLDETSAAPISVCGCAQFPLGVDGAGRLRQPASSVGNGAPAIGGLPGVALTPALPVQPAVPSDQNTSFEAPRMVVAPAGDRSACVISSVVTAGKNGVAAVLSFELAVTGAPASGAGSPLTQRFPVTGPDQITDVRLLGWSPAGLIVRVKSLKNGGLNADNISIRLIAADGSRSRVISRAAWRYFEPVAVAPDVVGTGVTVPGREPQFSSTDRAHLEFLFWRAWYLFGSRAVAVLLVVLGLGVVLLAARRRRMRSWRVGEED